MLVAAVESTTLSAVAYDESEEVLRLQFRGGATYEYSDVPAAVHVELLKESSKGEYFNRVIRGHFPYRPTPSDGKMVGAGRAHGTDFGRFTCREPDYRLHQPGRRHPLLSSRKNR